ncbi:unnamed protein product [Ceutorhynchus assimilis]|uniref:Uncharacterized protein n=1 Tax=Ceutorhynchus assimilis TaxID=467358 RepID=A0A9N9MDF9_9CUCU|nr:unnamed protein product [Ceutorhynchus assimilis]
MEENKIQMSQGIIEIIKLRDKSENLIIEKQEVAKKIKQFYTDFFSTIISNTIEEKRQILNISSEEIPEISQNILEMALNQIKSIKCPGENRVATKILKLSESASKNEEYLKTPIGGW